ncbi:MAG: hypothetical protein U0353_01395 [Sandaracinus sp.]
MSAFAELVATLPSWVRWGPFVFFPILAIGTLVPLTWLLESWLLRPLRALAPDAHWSERARVGFPARTRLVSWALSSTLLVAMAWVLWLGRLTPIGIAIAPSIGVLVATAITVLRVSRIVAPDRPRITLRGLVGMVVLGGGSSLLLVVLAVLASDAFDARTWLVLAIAITTSLVWALGLPTALATRVGLFRQPDAAAAAIVARSASRAGLPTPPTCVAELPMANAFAIVPAGRLVLTRAVIDELPESSLEAIVDHEMQSFAEPRRTRAVRVVSSIALVPLVLLRPMLGTWGLEGLFVLACLTAAVILVLARARHVLERGEHGERGDHGTGAPEAPRGVAYARVLERIYELNGIPAVMRGVLSRDASLYDRMIAAGATPSFARPAPPPRLLVPLVSCFVLALLALMGTRVALMWAELAHGERLGVIHLVIATTGGDANAFEQLGYARFLAGDMDGATTAYEAAAELEPDDAEPRALVARLRMMSGDCRGAVGAAWDASVVADRTGNARDRELVRSIRRELESCEPR